MFLSTRHLQGNKINNKEVCLMIVRTCDFIYLISRLDASRVAYDETLTLGRHTSSTREAADNHHSYSSCSSQPRSSGSAIVAAWPCDSLPRTSSYLMSAAHGNPRRSIHTVRYLSRHVVKLLATIERHPTGTNIIRALYTKLSISATHTPNSPSY